MTTRTLLALAVAVSLAGSVTVASAADRDRDASAAQARLVAPAGQQLVSGTSIRPAASAVVNFTDLAQQEAKLRATGAAPPVRVLMREVEQNDQAQPEAITGPAAAEPLSPFSPRLNVASPSPTSSFAGLDDIPMVDSSYIIIPPDVGGAVGPTKVMCTFNNNYRIQDKVTGATLATVGTATFWAPIEPAANLSSLTDPRTTYDPINNRWIAVMQTVNSNGDVLVAVSQTSDPAGAWFEYRFNGFTTNYLIDFPILGFNKNWIAVTINRYTTAGAFSRGICLAINYASALTGTGSATLFTQAAGTHFCTSPCVTISATEDTLFLVQHLSSPSATLAVDRITGTGAAPVYTAGATYTRPGGGWVQPSGQQLPQTTPVSGTSACSPPCLIEVQDSYVRSAPMYRVDATSGKGFIYYAQTVGLPSSGQTHTGVQWTKLTAGISATAPTSANAQFADGGRIEDATATATNGGKWYAYTHVAVNSLGDMLVGYSQFSSAQYPSAAYSYHDHADLAGTMRDPLVYKAGEDYYHKDFGSGRNRWGDFTTAQVDPSNDLSLWTLQEYAKARVSTDDGATGSNGSRWASYWAALSPVTQFAITASAGAGGTISPSGTVNVTQGANQTFNIAANSCFAIANVVVDGVSQGAITTFTFTNVQATHTISATFTALGPYTLAASAGAGGTITPPGNTNVACGGSQAYTITPAACFQVASVLVDGVSQGAITTFNFTNVQGNHTISATFTALGPYTLAASAGANGTITPPGNTPVACGGSQGYTITPAANYHVADVLVDGVSQGAVTTFNFTNVQANHTIAASFAITNYVITASSGANGSIAPVGADTVAAGSSPTFTMTANSGYYLSGLLVDGGAVTPAPTYQFTNVQANHTIAASYALDGSTIAAASTSATLGPNHPCDVIPVTLTRSGSTPVLGYSVTFRLSAGLALCAGTSSLVEGSFLNGAGATLFNVIDHGGGVYTVDDGLTANCGPTATTGTLFTIGVTSAAVSTPDTITIVSLKLRDCTNAALPTVAGGPATVPVDNVAPSVNVIAPNGGETLNPGDSFPLNWSATDLSGVTAVDLLLSRAGVAGVYDTLAANVPNSPPYGWTVTGPATADAWLKVVAVDALGNAGQATSAAAFTIGDLTGVGDSRPIAFALLPVAPNPVQKSCTIRFDVPRRSAVRIGVMDVRGREVAVLANGVHEAGRYATTWDGRTATGPAGAGIYFIRLEAAGKSIVRRFALVR